MTDNEPGDYIVIRVQLVNVKKGFFGLRDKKQLGSISYIPSTVEKAYQIFKRIDRNFKKHGVSLKEMS